MDPLDNREDLLTKKVKTLIGEYMLTILQLQTENEVLKEKLTNYQNIMDLSSIKQD